MTNKLICRWGLYFLLAWAIASRFFFSETIFSYGAGIIIVLFFLNLFINENKIREGLESLRGFGVFREYLPQPTPIASLMSSLKKQGVGRSDLKKVMFQTYTITEISKYLDGNHHTAKEFGLDRCEVHIYGYGTLEDAEFLKREFPKFKAHHTQKPLECHLNVILTKDGRTFIWFEPHHVPAVGSPVEDGYLPQKGAYLIEAPSAQAAEEKFHEFLSVA